MTNGYNPKFVGDGINIPLPKFNRKLGKSVLRKPGKLREDIYSDHINFTLVMNKDTRQLIYSAHNIDQSKFRPDPDGGKKSWRKDGDIGKEFQIGNEYYEDRTDSSGDKIKNPYDRGHMVMRNNAMWGDSPEKADLAGKATYTYANASLQHENLNRDEWKALETKIVREFSHDSNDKLCVFTGPIYGSLDRHVNLSDSNSARVPSGFFKVLCFRSKDSSTVNKLGVLAFAIFQDEKVLRDQKNKKTIKTNRAYQFTIKEIQKLTGIKFAKKIADLNPLFFSDLEERNKAHNVDRVPERIPLGSGETIISSGTEKRKQVCELDERRVIIVSAMINPKGNETRLEWVSLHNLSSRKIKIENWRLVDGKGREATLSGEILSGEAIKLKGKSKGKIRLSNKSGSLILFDNHSCIIDHVTWSESQLKNHKEGIAYMFSSDSN